MNTPNILYFAYGSNMDENQMAQRCPDSVLVGKAVLKDYAFCLDSEGVATIIPRRGSAVEGLVWNISPADEHRLDIREGVASGCYRKDSITVSMAGTPVNALVYISCRPLTREKIRHGYLQKIIYAALDHRLSDEYIEMLKGVR